MTHGWTERGKPKEREVSLEGPGSYEIVCEDDPEDEFFEISVPGGQGDNSR